MLLTGLSFTAPASDPSAAAPTAWFADGYHGGYYGHYPDGVTQFMVDQLKQHPEWKINLEIEPRTWDWIKTKTADAYQAFKALYEADANPSRIEYVNPTYGQGYLWNSSGESIIQQFHYGIQKLREHFPHAQFDTYSSEEPCFTSALPGILKSFGFKYAVLKNPNTCWGGYTRGFGAELVNWVGPDGTGIVAVPRYATEALDPKTAWNTIAADNTPGYIRSALAAGIANPIGMCYQDAGWRFGPWLRDGRKAYQPTRYVTWRDYLEHHSIRTPAQDWHFSQEDVQVSLMWGTQILQTLARQVRAAENHIVMAEKLAAMAGVYQRFPWPQANFDEAWRGLCVAQHHDCWIVPFNPTFAERKRFSVQAAENTQFTCQTSDALMGQAAASMSRAADPQAGTSIRVFNTLGLDRNDLATVTLPDDWTTPGARVMDADGKEVPSQLVTSPEAGGRQILFRPQVPALGYQTYQLEKSAASARQKDCPALAIGPLTLQTDLLTMVLDPARGGTIQSLKARTLGDREFVDQSSVRRFNELRGYFYTEGKWHSSADQPATITLVENGPIRVRARVQGRIDAHPFTQMVTMVQGQRRIDVSLKIDWQGDPDIGAEATEWHPTDHKRAFYDDRAKLLALFPAKLEAQRIYKNAPFDVTESRLEDTFFNTWEAIKNNVILNWVDVNDGPGRFGLTLLSDHTTSYVHGADHPLGLTLQYSGVGLWGRKYRIKGPTELSYALVPHAEKWDKAALWSESDRWNEPLVTAVMKGSQDLQSARKSLVSVAGSGWEIPAMTLDKGALAVRLFNAEGDAAPRKITFDGRAQSVRLVRLNGETINDLAMHVDPAGRTVVSVALPRFGVATVVFSLESR